MILQKRTLHALCFFVVDCDHIDLGFMVHLKRLLHIIWRFRYLVHLFLKKNYYQHVRNAFLDVCTNSVPVWDKGGEMRGLLRGEKS